jgi:hypothetical protein
MVGEGRAGFGVRNCSPWRARVWSTPDVIPVSPVAVLSFRFRILAWEGRGPTTRVMSPNPTEDESAVRKVAQFATTHWSVVRQQTSKIISA